MRAPRLRITIGEKSRVYEVLDRDFTAGSAPDRDVKLAAPGVAGAHLRFAAEAGGLRVSVEPGASMTVNHLPVDHWLLHHGDRVRVGECTLEYLDRAAEAQPPRPAPALPSAASPRARLARARPRRPAASPALRSAIVVSAAAAVALLIRVLSDDAFGKSAGELVALAQSQFVEGTAERVLDTLAAAESRDRDGTFATQIAQLRARVARLQREQADAPQITAALEKARALRSLAAAHAAGPSRPAARLIVATADQWLAQFAEVCRRYEERRDTVAEIEELRAKHAPAARLEEPDNYEDVAFVVDHLTGMRRRRYREAMAALDAFLASAQGREAELAAARREELLRGGEEWMREQVEILRRALAAGRDDAVESELRILIEQLAVDAWIPELRRFESEVLAARRPR
jgi:hypothetical protein